MLSLFSQKTVIQKKEKRGKSYRSCWFLQLLLEAKERVVVGSFYEMMSCVKVAGSRDPYQVQSPVMLGFANLGVKGFLLLPWAAKWYQDSGG